MSKSMLSENLITTFCAICLVGVVTAGAVTRSNNAVTRSNNNDAQTNKQHIAAVADVADTENAVSTTEAVSADEFSGLTMTTQATFAEDSTEESSTVTANKVMDVPDGLGKPWYTPMTEDGYIPVKFSGVDGDYLRVRPASKTAVALSYGSQVANIVRTGTGGVAQLLGGREGLHSVVASGLDGVAAYGVYVSNDAGDFPLPPPPATNVGLVPLGDTKLIYEILSRPVSNSQAQGQVVAETEMSGESSLREPILYAGEDGYIRARIIIPSKDVARAYSGADVTFIRNGEVLAAAETDSMGIYSIPSATVPNGFVSIVVNGPQGYMVYAAEVRNAIPNAADNTKEEAGEEGKPAAPDLPLNAMNAFVNGSHVYFDENVSTSTGVPASNSTKSQLLQSIEEAQQFLQQQAEGGGTQGGGAPGSTGGGSGGAGSGFGEGLLAGALAGGIAGALLADDDDPVSPPGP